MKRMITLCDIQNAITLSNEMAAEILEKFVETAIKRQMSVEDAERFAHQVGYATMTVALYHHLGVKEICN